MKRLGLIHTVPFLVDLFKKLLAERYPNLESFHILDESILQEVARHGGLTPNVVRRITLQAINARDAGAGLIVFTCSATGPSIETARQTVDVPILMIDDPMASTAVRMGRRIGLVCTNPTTRVPSETLIKRHAAEQGKDVEVTVALEAEAFEAVLAGDKERHDAIVKEAARKISQQTDVVVLAQASMAHLAPELNKTLAVPVLASPALCVEALADMLVE